MAIGSAILCLCAITGVYLANQRTKDEILQISISKPGLEDFYGIYTRTRFWSDQLQQAKKYDIFSLLIERKPPA